MNELERVSACSAALIAAPFEKGGWGRAVDWFSEATNSRAGQLIGRTSSGLTSFHLVTANLGAAEHDWLASGGLDPQISPMVQAAARRPILQSFTDTDVLTAESRKRNVFWTTVHEHWDIPHVSCTVLWREGNDQIVLAAVRSAADGYFRSEDRRKLAALVPRWRAAIVLTAALREEGALLMANGLEAASINAIMLDEFGRIVATTSRGEALLQRGRWFRGCRSALIAKSDRNHAVLADALTYGRLRPAPRRLQFLDSGGGIDLTVAQLPTSCEIGFGAATLVIMENEVEIRGLTLAEYDIIRSLLAGLPLAEIALKRGTSAETVRGQAKAIYAKAGVGGQLELLRSIAAANRPRSW